MTTVVRDDATASVPAITADTTTAIDATASTSAFTAGTMATIDATAATSDIAASTTTLDGNISIAVPFPVAAAIASPSVGSTAAKIFLPEGSTIRVVKPELSIRFLPVNRLPEETVSRRFKLSDKVSAVKGWTVERVKERLASDDALVASNRVVVMRRGERLKDNQMLVDLVGELDVAIPEDAISFRESNPSLELETDLFSMFG